MFGSSSPFGASTPSPFGSATTASYPFGSTPSANPFGANQASPFGPKPFGGASFGAQTGNSMFGSGTATSVFGSSQPGSFGATTPAFGGSTSTPSFGSTQFGGPSVFGQKPATPFGSFGTAGPVQANPFGAPTFGQTQSAFGSQTFGTTPAFGASSPAFGSTASPGFGASNPAFAASSTPSFGATSTPSFGSSTPAFGSTTPGFGQSAPAFGATTTTAFGSTPVFGGGSTSPFGVQAVSAFGATTSPTFGTSAFGATTFGGQRAGTRMSPYTATNDPDTSAGQGGKFMSISAMPVYKSKSPEELRWEDYQSKDKGGLHPATQPVPAGGIFGASQPATNPFGGTTPFAQSSNQNPFAGATTSSLFTQSKPAFGASTTPAFGTGTTSFGSSFGSGTSPFGSQPSATAFGTSSSPAFGIAASPFGASSPAFSSGAFGASSSAFGASIFSSTSLAFGSSSAFSASASTPNFTSSPGFGGGLFGGQSSASIFSGSSSPAFGASTPAFGASSGPSFGGGLFNNTTPSSIFPQPKPAGLASSTPSTLFGAFATPGPTSGAYSFPQNFGVSPQPGGSIFGAGSQAPAFGAATYTQQALQSVLAATPLPVSNPFGTLPAMPQMSIARSAGTGPSVQYGISSMPVYPKPAQVHTTSLLTPRHITQRSKVRLHARRYHPKKDSPKVSFFNDSEETPNTPKADVLFVPRENPRALFIRQPDQPPSSPSVFAKYGADVREIATPLQKSRFESQEREVSNGESPRASRPSPNRDDSLQASVLPLKSQKSGTKQNGARDEHSHRGNGYISITGHRAGEAAIAYEHGADIEALMPKLRHSDYYTEPRIQELAAKERAESGYCRRVIDFVVGRRQFGSVKFLGETDVRRLDLEGIVQFNKCEVLVYMDESKKPAVGQGLNKAAEVTLLNVKCVDKKTGQQYMDGLEADRFEKKLKRKTEEQGAEFVSYNALKGEWTFRVKHFSRYGLDESDEEEAYARDLKDAVALAGTDMMEGVEGFHRSLENKPEQVLDRIIETSNQVEAGDELEDMQIINMQSALPHSLPVQLRLDPVKMHQMRSLFFPLQDVEDAAQLGLCSKAVTGNSRATKFVSIQADRQTDGSTSQHKFGHRGEGALTPPVAGCSRSRRSLQAAWKGSSHLHSQISAELSAYKVLPDSPPFVSPVCSRSLTSTGESSVSKRPRLCGFNRDARSVVHSKFDHVSDAALFLGSSFRVGWGPQGRLVHSGMLVGSSNSDGRMSSCIHVEKVALDRTCMDKEGNVQAELVELQFVSPLSLHFSMSQICHGSVEQHELKLRRLICTGKELPGVCGDYGSLAKKQQVINAVSPEDSIVLRHQSTVWQLMDVLFSERCHTRVSTVMHDDGSEDGRISECKSAIDTDAHVLVTRAKFSSWLQDSVGHLLARDLQWMTEVEYRKLFLLLTARQLDDAVEQAFIIGDVRMALLLSQAGGPLVNREDLSAQINLWAREGADQSLIDLEHFRIFKLLAGDVQGALGTSTVDWKRYLGLLMWYQLAPDTELGKIIGKYWQHVDHGEAPPPIPMYLEDNGVKTLGPNMCFDSNYYLLLLHAQLADESSLGKMLSCGSSTFDRLDHRLAWHQQGVLEAVGVLEFPPVHALHMNFVGQLLAVGLCHWALYVVLHMPSSPQHNHIHENVVREILLQYCETWSHSELQMQFLVDVLHVPLKWLHEAQAIYWQYVRDSNKALKHLMKSFQWHAAHSMFMSTIAPVWFTSGKHSDVWNCATKLEAHRAEIESWSSGAAIFLEFYSLKNRLEHLLELFDSRDAMQSSAEVTKIFLAHLQESRVVWLTRSSAELSVAYSKMADTVAHLLLSKSAALPFSSTMGLDLYKAIMDSTVPGDKHLSRLRGAASTFSSSLSGAVFV